MCKVRSRITKDDFTVMWNRVFTVFCFFFIVGQRGSIQWCDNWVAFMDNMLQMKILQTDTRSIFVPTSVEKLSIDVTKHGAVLQTSQVAAGKSGKIRRLFFF